MKSQYIAVIAGALLSATLSVAQTSAPITYKIPAAGQIHADYQLASRMQMIYTMDGAKDIVDWECYVDFDRRNNRPAYRRSAWLVGLVNNPQGKKLSLNLHTIGAQHRSSIVLIRLVPGNGGSPGTTVLMQRAAAGNAVNRVCKRVGETDPGSPFADFYLIERSEPDILSMDLLNQYELTTSDPMLKIEAMFLNHLPGTHDAQTEDGGPPPIPPGNEN